MSRYKVSLEPLPAQTFTAALGGYTLTIELRWMSRLEVFRVNLYTAQGAALTLGRYLLPGVDLLAGLYPPTDANYGSLVLEGEPATPSNLGVDNMLVWTNG